MKLYHITPSDNLPSILKYGLQPRSGGTLRDPEYDFGSREARIYLTSNPQDVLDFALRHIGDWAVLEVQVEDTGLYPDPYEESHYYSTKGIPKRDILIVGIYHNE